MVHIRVRPAYIGQLADCGFIAAGAEPLKARHGIVSSRGRVRKSPVQAGEASQLYYIASGGAVRVTTAGRTSFRDILSQPCFARRASIKRRDATGCYQHPSTANGGESTW
ncbi:unnamed protein product [Sphagnum balticum]